MRNVHSRLLFVFLMLMFSASPVWAAPLTLGPGPHTIDTDSGAIDAVISPDWNGTSFNIDDLDIQTGATVTAAGTQALIFNVNGSATITGSIDASGGDGADIGDCDSEGAIGGGAGPGGYDGGTGGGTVGINGEPGAGPGGGGGGEVTSEDTDDTAGGGGAGHLYDGSPGETSNAGIPGAAGSPYASLPPLIGGSGGGGGSAEDDAREGEIDPGDDGGAGGGAGAGAVQITATGLITVDGMIDASGGNGGNGDCSSAGGGGGSGGAIELISNTATPTVTGTLDVSGGLGGIGDNDNDGGDASEGRVRTLFLDSTPTPIPTLNEWGMILFMAFVGITGIYYLNRKTEIV